MRAEGDADATEEDLLPPPLPPVVPTTAIASGSAMAGAPPPAAPATVYFNPNHPLNQHNGAVHGLSTIPAPITHVPPHLTNFAHMLISEDADGSSATAGAASPAAPVLLPASTPHRLDDADAMYTNDANLIDNDLAFDSVSNCQSSSSTSSSTSNSKFGNASNVSEKVAMKMPYLSHAWRLEDAIELVTRAHAGELKAQSALGEAYYSDWKHFCCHVPVRCPY